MGLSWKLVFRCFRTRRPWKATCTTCAVWWRFCGLCQRLNSEFKKAAVKYCFIHNFKNVALGPAQMRVVRSLFGPPSESQSYLYNSAPNFTATVSIVMLPGRSASSLCTLCIFDKDQGMTLKYLGRMRRLGTFHALSSFVTLCVFQCFQPPISVSVPVESGDTWLHVAL